MDIEPVDDQYFTYHGRLASFQKSKKRGSTAKGSKALNWPHKSIAPEDLARAGFFFQPWPENPDNCVCFLCHKSMDGWEAGDDPLVEHLKHSTSCGWAITAAVEAEIESYAQVHPADPTMVEARKATFAGRWPHDGKRGWTCKTKQLVDAGWKYTPTPDSDDNATCTYCSLGLDGWEPKDKPYDEHYNRSPNCPFFLLSSRPNPSKKKARGKAARGSKASRLSTQSVATYASEAPSMADTTIATTAAGDDTVLTTTSTMTQGTTKSRAKKGTATKSRKTKAKKEEPVEVEEKPAPEEHELSPVAPAPKRATRGKKRGSDAVDESTMTVISQAPARKKRATKNRASAAVESSVVEPPEDQEMTDAPAPKKTTAGKKGRVSTAKRTRKASTRSNTSMASVSSFHTPPAEFPDDDEIERQLEADLERPLTDDEDIAADSDSERNKKTKAKTAKGKKTTSAKKSEDYAMFDPAPAELDDNDVDDELDALRAEMEMEELNRAPEMELVEELEPEAEPEPEPELELEHEPEREPESEPEREPEPEPEQLKVPKKGRKAGPRKASRQAKPKKAKASEPPPEDEVPPAVPEPAVEPEPQPELAEQFPDERDASLGSTDTVVKKSEPELARNHSRARESLSRSFLASQGSSEADELAEDPVELQPAEHVQPPKKRGRGRQSKASTASVESVQPNGKLVEPVEHVEPPKKRGRGQPSKSSMASVESVQPTEQPTETVEPPKKRGRGRPPKASQEDVSAGAAQERPADPPAKRGRGRPPKKLSSESKSSEAAAQLQEEAKEAEMRAQEEALEHGEELDIYEEDPGLSPVQESPVIPSSASQQFAQIPSTPGYGVSPSASGRQAALSPSQSPQSSDAENEPPSSKPAASATTRRVALAPIEATPVRGSPSKRNVLAGLQTKIPWKPLDLDAVLGTPFAGAEKENGVDRLLRKGKELTSPEKRMTVEEWIYFNAGEAEKMLKHECESMVSRFEREGTKAMNVLEGLVVTE